jgi:hypothetical protein
MLNNSKNFQKWQMPGQQKGVAVVEFGLVIILLLMIVGAIIEFGRVFWYYDALTKATRDGARFMSKSDKAIIASTEVNAAYSVVTCVDGTAPENVRVTIINFEVVIGGLMPLFVATGGLADYDAVTLAPHTTMRYLR